jgi:NCS1 family nucleobase:cation symporter-1
MSDGNVAQIEQHTIYQIPLDQRHGRPGSLFTLWFGSNITILTIVTGALATTIYGLDLTGSILSILVGNLVGGIFMALHAAQGPRLGVPQMVQSRGQFGSIGALVVVVLVIVMYTGFVASNLVLGGQSLRVVVPGTSDATGILLIGGISLAAAIWGHDLIHAYAKVMTWLAGLALAFCFCWILFAGRLQGDVLGRGHESVAGFFGMVSVGALWQIAYAPYVSDYSRYLPEETGEWPAFQASYWGCVVGSVLPMVLGALVGLAVPEGDLVVGLADLMQPWSLAITLIFSVGIAAANAVNIYCCALSAITVGQTLAPGWRAGPVSRVVLSLIFFSGAVLIALWGAKDFLTNYTNFIAILLYVMVPWTAVNLVDYYLVQHGSYDVAAFFRRDGGIYGRYNGKALASYALGILVQLPFMVTDLYTGPLALMLDRVDISWIVGLAIVSPVYYLLARVRPALS